MKRQLVAGFLFLKEVLILRTQRKIIKSSLLLTVVLLALVAGGSAAFYSDTEKSVDNYLRAGAVDLKISNDSYYNGFSSVENTWRMDDLNGQLFFNFSDLKPGDWGEDTIGFLVVDNDAWLCMNVDVTSTLENEIIEPEVPFDETAGENEGELQNYLQFVFWADDGDNVLEDDEFGSVVKNGVAIHELGMISLADSTVNIWTGIEGDPIEGGEEEPIYHLGKAWCFGNLELTPVPQGSGNSPADNPGITCDGRFAGNDAQTDAVLADVTFTAIQSRHNGAFKCTGCDEREDSWAVVYSEVNQGLTKGGTSVLPSRSDPNSVLGPADETGFFSLGFGGSIVVSFGYPVVGPLIVTHETTNGTYPLDKANIEVWDGSTWYNLGEVTSAGDGIHSVDFSPLGLPEIYAVRITDSTDPSIHANDSDGFDLDAVMTTVCKD